MSDWQEQERKKWEVIGYKDECAKATKSLVGRYIMEQCCDSHAVYEIIKENKKTVRIRVLRVGDEWEIPYWGEEANIDIEYARQSVERRDRLADLFDKRIVEN